MVNFNVNTIVLSIIVVIVLITVYASTIPIAQDAGDSMRIQNISTTTLVTETLDVFNQSQPFNVTINNETAIISITDVGNGSQSFSFEVEFCYQESSNASHSNDGSCSLNYTGLYDSSNWHPVNTTQAYDGEWGTFSTYGFPPPPAPDAELYINYSLPSDIDLGKEQRVFWRNGNVNRTQTVPTNCTANGDGLLQLVYVLDSGGGGGWS